MLCNGDRSSKLSFVQRLAILKATGTDIKYSKKQKLLHIGKVCDEKEHITAYNESLLEFGTM